VVTRARDLVNQEEKAAAPDSMENSMDVFMMGKGDEDEGLPLPHFRRAAFKPVLDADESGIALRQQKTSRKRGLTKEKKLRMNRNLPAPEPANRFQSLSMNAPLVPLISADIPYLPDQDDDNLEEKMMENCL
jgi:hypothetical protein